MTRTAPLILVVDDDPAIRQTLTQEMALAGYDAISAADGLEGKAVFLERRPDLVITDLAMPRLDGLGLLMAVRRVDSTPVLILCVRGEKEDTVQALDFGADDCITKPFSPRELLARVRTQFRRPTAAPPEVFRFPGLEIDRARRAVTRDGREVHLAPTELAILELLASRAGRLVTLRQILAAVWKGAPATTADTVRVHVGSLRRKIEPDPELPRYIGREPWVGYRFLVEEEPGT
jgi:two-component system KDP operon response regulator KdpE